VSSVIFSPEARRDLQEIGGYIAQDSPARALTFVQELREKAKKIAFKPRAYPPRNDLRPGLRMAVHGRYLIFFEIAGAEIHILRFTHGARDLPRMFKD
jgi:toxin ParE1/3/4